MLLIYNECRRKAAYAAVRLRAQEALVAALVGSSFSMTRRWGPIYRTLN